MKVQAQTLGRKIEGAGRDGLWRELEADISEVAVREDLPGYPRQFLFV